MVRSSNSRTATGRDTAKLGPEDVDLFLHRGIPDRPASTPQPPTDRTANAQPDQPRHPPAIKTIATQAGHAQPRSKPRLLRRRAAPAARNSRANAVAKSTRRLSFVGLLTFSFTGPITVSSALSRRHPRPPRRLRLEIEVPEPGPGARESRETTTRPVSVARVACETASGPPLQDQGETQSEKGRPRRDPRRRPDQEDSQVVHGRLPLSWSCGRPPWPPLHRASRPAGARRRSVAPVRTVRTSRSSRSLERPGRARLPAISGKHPRMCARLVEERPLVVRLGTETLSPRGSHQRGDRRIGEIQPRRRQLVRTSATVAGASPRPQNACIT